MKLTIDQRIGHLLKAGKLRQQQQKADMERIQKLLALAERSLHGSGIG